MRWFFLMVLAGCTADPPCTPAPTMYSGRIDAYVGVDALGKKRWQYTANEGALLLNVEVYESGGGPTRAPAAGEINAAQSGYDTCGTCVLFQSGCRGHGDHFHCGKDFMPRAGKGRWSLTRLDDAAKGRITGVLEDVVLEEVTIGEGGKTSRVPGGETYCLARLTFDAELKPPRVACGGHGTLQGEKCKCDVGYALDPMNEENCISASDASTD